MLTLAILDVEHSEPGTQVTFVWGEEGGGSSKPTVERHAQLDRDGRAGALQRSGANVVSRRLERLQASL